MPQFPEGQIPLIALSIMPNKKELVAYIASALSTESVEQQIEKNPGVVVATINFGIFEECGMIQEWTDLMQKLTAKFTAIAYKHLTGRELPKEPTVLDATDELKDYHKKKAAHERN